MFAMVAASVWSSGSSVWEILSEKHTVPSAAALADGRCLDEPRARVSVSWEHARKQIYNQGRGRREESRSKRADYAGPSPRDGPGCCVGVLWHMGPRSRGEGGGRRRRGRGPMKGAYTAEPVRIHTPY